MLMRYTLLIFLLKLCFVSFSQEKNPSVVYQNTFGGSTALEFQLLPGNKYLLGYGLNGEYIMWDLFSGKIVKKINVYNNDVSKVYYQPKPSVSHDGEKILIPVYPDGFFEVYDIMQNRVIHTLKPSGDDEVYTRAFFHEEGYLVVSHFPGSINTFSLKYYDENAKMVNQWYYRLPITKGVESKLKVVGAFKQQISEPTLSGAAWDEDSGKLYLSNSYRQLYAVRPFASHYSGMVEINNYHHSVIDEEVGTIVDLAWKDDRLLVKKGLFSSRKSNPKTYSQSILIIDPQKRKIENTVESKYVTLDTSKHSNGHPFVIRTMNSSWSAYYDVQDVSKNSFRMIAKDIFTDRELFSLATGEKKMWNNADSYEAGQLNGGMVVELSDDQSLLVELSHDLVVHNLKTNNIKNVLSLGGNIKLGTPVFLDTETLLVPKLSGDGFLFDMKEGNIRKLKQLANCVDTARNSAVIKYHYEEDVLMGLGNFTFSKDSNFIVGANYYSDGFCEGLDYKEIVIYDRIKLNPLYKYKINERYRTYNLEMLPGRPHSFLMNNKLVSFQENKISEEIDLNIINKRDTLHGFSPKYLADRGQILSVLSRRGKFSKNEIVFAFYDLQGKLIEKIVYKKPRTRVNFQTIITELKLSEDNNKLLFCFIDGTGGIFDIETKQVIFTFSHNRAPKNLVENTIVIAITSANFIDNKRFVTCGSNGTIFLWEMHNGTPVRRINKELLVMYSIQSSPDKKYLIGVESNKQVKFLDFVTGETKAEFVALDHETHAVIDRNGYYMTNKYTNNNLWFFSNGKTYELSQFDLKLNRPDKVLSTLGYAPRETIDYFNRLYKERIRHSGFEEAKVENSTIDNIPEISVTGLPEDLIELKKTYLDFQVKLLSKNIKKVLVNVNGVPVDGVKGRSVDGPQSIIPFRIPILEGVNHITISAKNAEGVESEKEYVNVKRVLGSSKPNLHLVSIGVGDYYNKELKRLQLPVKDAQDVADIFRKSKMFDKVEVKLLLDKEVSREKVVAFKKDLLKTKPEDFVIIYYSGHGLFGSNEEYCLATHKTDMKNINKTSILYQDIEDILDGIPSLNRLVFVDACFSGEVDKTSMEKAVEDNTVPSDSTKVFSKGGMPGNTRNSPVFESMKSLFPDLRVNTGITVLASSKGGEESFELQKLNNGAFTHCLLKGLNSMKADLNGNKEITISELLNFLKAEVPVVTNGVQSPVSRTENYVKDYVIWK